MTSIETKQAEIIAFCKANADETIVKKYSRYFKEGYKGYGIDTKIYTAQKEKWLKEWKDEMSIDDYLDLGDQLIATGIFEEGSFAIGFLEAQHENYTKDTFDRAGKWLENGIQNWANTDVLCMLVLSKFLSKKILTPTDFKEWIPSSSKWKRRAVPVTFVEAIKAGDNPKEILLAIEDLMEDSEEDVQKGLGTLLREIWKKEPGMAEDFLLKWKDLCGRKIVQYATEKMTKENKARFKRTKN